MRKVSMSTCKKYKSSAFHNVEDLNQLNPLKIISLGFVCKGNDFFSILQINPKKKARSPAGFRKKYPILSLQIPSEETIAKVRI